MASFDAALPPLGRPFLGLAIVLCACGPSGPATPPELLITDARVVDVTDGSISEPTDIAVTGGTIEWMGPAGLAQPDSATQVIDASGTWVIPGLHDMHSHLWDRGMLAQAYLDYGITSVRDMGGARGGWRRWAEETDSIPVPRAMDGGTIIDGIDTGSFFFGRANDRAEGRRWVDSVAALGADFVKVYSRLSDEAFLGAVERADELGLPFAGHVPLGIPASRALDLGMRSIEHFTGIALECSPGGPERRQAIRAALAPVQQADSADPSAVSDAVGETYVLERWVSLEEYDPTACPELMDRVAQGDVWLTPTLVVSSGDPDAQRTRVQPHLDAWPTWMHGMMLPSEARRGESTPERLRGLRRMFADLDAAGARWLAGADAPNPGSAPGIGLHQELELLVDFGLSPVEALQAATLHAAEFEGRSNRSGSVEVGKDADLLLLEGNPLEAIANTQRIRGVLLGGRMVSGR